LAISRRYNPDKMDELGKPRLITDRFTAAVSVILTGYVTVLTLRSALWQAPHHRHWILQLDYLLPPWAVLVANVALYAWILWLSIAFPRALQGKEWFLAAGWVPGLLLSPIQGMVSASLAAAIQYAKAVSIMVAFVAAIAILVEGPQKDTTASDGAVPQ
jgi:uncharacterized membrane protein